MLYRLFREIYFFNLRSISFNNYIAKYDLETKTTAPKAILGLIFFCSVLADKNLKEGIQIY